MNAPATLTLADYLVNTTFENLPSDVVEKAKLCLMDSLGCFFGGHRRRLHLGALSGSRLAGISLRDFGQRPRPR